MFEIKQFSSGEYEVKLIERIRNNEAIIHWNWFDESQRDLMLLLAKIDAVRTTYGQYMKIIVDAPYLPYGRQDRVFENGQGIPSNILINVLDKQLVMIVTQGYHSDAKNWNLKNNIITLSQEILDNYNLVFPDKNAQKHYIHRNTDYITFDKIRSDKGVQLIINKNSASPNIRKTFLILDDICAGGRTFVECAKALKKEYGENITIELVVYHAFLDYGLDALKESGISKIKIFNEDSYNYLMKKYPNEQEYITL